MKPSSKIIAGASAALVLSLGVWWLATRPQPAASPSTSTLPEAMPAKPVPAASEATSSAATNEAPVSTPESIGDTSAEVAATRRMYMAHAPLREPEIADPDSETNRRVLETMVAKALGRAAPADASPAAATPTVTP